MKAENYLYNYISECNISVEQVKNDIGIDIEKILSGKNELMVDEFLRLCIYLKITPEEVISQIL